MKWTGRQGSSNVEDRRGQSSQGSFGGLGRLGGLGNGGKGCGCTGSIGVIIIAIVIWLMGGNPLQLIGMLEDAGGGAIFNNTPNQEQAYNSAEEDSLFEFARVVLYDTEEIWTSIFRQMGKEYRKPTLITYNSYTSSGCGTAQSSTGPFYCPADEKIYLDLSFFKQMDAQFHAPGDFAYAYVIAHEVGHHVQKLLGTLDEINSEMARSNKKRANELSVCLELQADFYAGVWANRESKLFDALEPGDIDEALNAASAIGDDRLQKEAQGYTVPDSFTHGTSQQRHDWFYNGYNTGDISKGNTFEKLMRR
ncbi:MAG: neutral zinc metallopeptidase [Dysgonamonadaceae bacterium]|jgi:predicted metalloprotease|nr:neutral zinc metallopeptidase [Dysgonamonadaceae bacterium]